MAKPEAEEEAGLEHQLEAFLGRVGEQGEPGAVILETSCPGSEDKKRGLVQEPRALPYRLEQGAGEQGGEETLFMSKQGGRWW